MIKVLKAIIKMDRNGRVLPSSTIYLRDSFNSMDKALNTYNITDPDMIKRSKSGLLTIMKQKKLRSKYEFTEYTYDIYYETKTISQHNDVIRIHDLHSNELVDVNIPLMETDDNFITARLYINSDMHRPSIELLPLGMDGLPIKRRLLSKQYLKGLYSYDTNYPSILDIDSDILYDTQLKNLIRTRERIMSELNRVTDEVKSLSEELDIVKDQISKHCKNMR